jgi:hypothetical protein
MRWVTLFSTTSLSLLMAGCLGGYQPGQNGNMTPGTDGSTIVTPGTPPNAEALFLNNVQPFISTECASCHATDGLSSGPKFLGSTGAYYGQLVNDPRMVNSDPMKSYLITHQHMLGSGMGTNPSPVQVQAIVDWITQENKERSLPMPPPGGMVPYDALAQFAACMTLTDYNSSGMNNIWKQNVNGNLGNCSSCHQNGEHQVMLSVTSDNNFKALQSDVRHWLKLASADLTTDGTCSDITASQRFYMVGTGQDTHPSFTQTTVKTAVDTFFQDTYTRWKAGNCGGSPDGGAPMDGGL